MPPTFRSCAAAAVVFLLAGPAVGAEAARSPLSAVQAREDVQLAIDAVEAALPNIYWRQSPEAWALAKATAMAEVETIDDPMRIYAVLAPLMGQIGEGHLSVLPPQAAIARQRQAASGLPLDLHWNTAGVFVSRAYGEAADIPIGSRLLEINGEGYDELLDELTAMTPHDGHIRTGPMREGGGDRYAVLRHRLRGDEQTFRLKYVDAAGLVMERVVTATPFSERTKVRRLESDIAALEWIEPGLAYLRVPTFSNRVYREAGKSFRGEISAIFVELRQARATRLILDLRENGGGSEPNESILFSFLVEQPLHKYGAVEARGREVAVRSLSGDIFSHEIFDHDEIALQEELPNGRLRRQSVAPEGLMSHWKPSAPVFEGRLVILAGGCTFSGVDALSRSTRRFRRRRGRRGP